MGIPNDGRTPQDELEEMMKAIEEDVAKNNNDNEEIELDEEVEEHAEKEKNENTEDNEEKEEENEDEEEQKNNDEEDEGDDNFTPITVFLDGKEVVIENEERVKELLQKAVKSEVAPLKKKLSKSDKMIEQLGLNKADLELLANIKSGNKGAIAKLLADLEVEEIDIEDAEKYSPEITYQEESEIDEVANEILADEDWAEKYGTVRKTLPSDFIEKIENNTELLRSFSTHVKIGLAQEILPKLPEYIANNGGDFLNAYDTVGRAMIEEKQREYNKKKEEKPKRKVDKDARDRMQRNKNSQSGENTSTEDVFSMNEEELEEFKKSIINMR